MASALGMEMVFDSQPVVVHSSFSIHFDGDSDESSNCLSTPSPPALPEINCVQDLPQVIINNFDLSQISNPNLPLAFFMTKCTPEVFGPFLGSGFLEILNKSGFWKLYMTELMYGYLSYVVNSQQGNIWNHQEETATAIPPKYPIGFIEKLRNTGKIRVLRKHVAETIRLSDETVPQTGIEHEIGLQATVLTPGLISQVIQFDILKHSPHLTCLSSTHIGTMIPHDMMLKGCYPMPPHEQGGFPLLPRRNFREDNCTQNSATRTVFSRRLKKIAHSFRNPRIHYCVKICDSDKLVDLWYLKNFSDQFSTKIHVSPEYNEFVGQFISQFSDCFTTGNSDAKIHYECCPKVGDCYLPLGCIMNTIWINGKLEKSSDINLPFIHDL